MIYPYVKVNEKVVDLLGVKEERYQFPDGNYLLWKFDLMNIGGNNDETLRRIGGIGMSSEQVRQEQQGITTTPLPEPEDEIFRLDTENESVDVSVEGEVSEEPIVEPEGESNVEPTEENDYE